MTAMQMPKYTHTPNISHIVGNLAYKDPIYMWTEHHRNVFIMWHLHCAIHEKYEKTHNYFIAVSRLIGERTIDSMIPSEIHWNYSIHLTIRKKMHEESNRWNGNYVLFLRSFKTTSILCLQFACFASLFVGICNKSIEHLICFNAIRSIGWGFDGN